MVGKQTSKETYMLYFALGVIVFIFICWLINLYQFQRRIINAKPYINTPLTPNTGSQKTYTWIVHMYPPNHNAGAEMMAHAMNTFLVRESNAKVNVILNQKQEIGNYERVNLIWRGDNEKRIKTIESAQLLLSHLDNEPNAITTAVIGNKPLVLVMHNSFRMKFLKEFKKILPNNLYLIHNSEWIKKYYEPLGIPSIVVYPPVSWQDYSVTSSKEFVSLINMNENKGGKIFLEICKRMPDVRFLGVKGAYDKQMMKSLKNLVLIDNTPQIKEIYSRTGILLMPSKYESWGRTAVEAMSSGIPVIAHPTPGLVESCGSAGIFCDRDDIDSWIKEIRKLKTDSSYYEEKSKACLARARELDPEPQLEKMSKWLEEIKWKD
jgi:glycosyltransferase involved in cell wall biosynthesis